MPSGIFLTDIALFNTEFEACVDMNTKNGSIFLYLYPTNY